MLSGRFLKEQFETLSRSPIPVWSDKTERNLKDWVEIAEQLAAENGGFIPATGVLKKNRMTGLVRRLTINPEAFSHIRKLRSKTDDYVQIAESLAAGNNGELPSISALQKSHKKLVWSMYRNPDAFAHIGISRERLGLEEAIQELEQLSRKHGGLPRGHQRKIMGLHKFDYWIKNFPDRFSHFKLLPKRTRAEKFRTFAQAKVFARSNKIKSSTRWKQISRPSDIPADPSKMYKNKGWKSWPHFLGTE